jgi:hypothetical protein
MRLSALQVAWWSFIGITALVIPWPAAGQTASGPVGLTAGGDRIALSIIAAAGLFKLVDLWISNLRALGEIKSDIASLQAVSGETDGVEMERS